MQPRPIDEFWSRFFGLVVDEYLRPGGRVAPHCSLEGYWGVWVFHHGETCIISVPPTLVATTEAAAQGLSPKDLRLPEQAVALFGALAERVIGPAYQGHVERTWFRPEVRPGARRLTPDDGEALQRLASACQGEEWEHSGIELDLSRTPHPVFGCFTGGRLAAAAQYRAEDGAGMIGVVTHPEYRGRGWGRAAVSLATQHGLRAGHLMCYQTLQANVPSVALASALGYRQYAWHIAIRLKPQQP